MRNIRSLAIFVLFLPLVACGQSCNSADKPVQDSIEVGIEIFERAYDRVYGNYYDVASVSPSKMFGAASDELEKRLKDKGFEAKKIPAGTDYYGSLAILNDNLKRGRALLPDVAEKNHLTFAAVAAMLDSLGDSHTYFIDPEQYREYQNRKSGKSTHSGVGISLGRLEKDFYYIEYVFEGGPADLAGLKRFDHLIAVDGVKIPDKFEEIVKMVRGPPGTKVKLTITRAGEEKVFEVTRANVRNKAAVYEILKSGDKSFGYFRLYGFLDDESYIRLLEFRDKFREVGVSGLIIDLRGNPGGSIRSLNAFLDFFLPAATETFIEKGRRRSYTNGTFSGAQTNLPISVLINNGSGSASEVFSAVLQEQGRAKIFGETSSGAVSEGMVLPLPNGAAMMVTLAQIFTAKGKKLEKVGVKPDIEVKLTKEAIEAGKDTQLEEAIKVLNPR